MVIKKGFEFGAVRQSVPPVADIGADTDGTFQKTLEEVSPV
jgi:hypothetical protein